MTPNLEYQPEAWYGVAVSLHEGAEASLQALLCG